MRTQKLQQTLGVFQAEVEEIEIIDATSGRKDIKSRAGTIPVPASGDESLMQSMEDFFLQVISGETGGVISPVSVNRSSGHDFKRREQSADQSSAALARGRPGQRGRG